MRRKQAGLSENQWDNVIDAMKCLKKSKRSHNWDFFVDTHKKYADHQHSDSPHINGADTTIHSPFYWLAWHRKFLLEFEKELKADGMRVDLPTGTGRKPVKFPIICAWSYSDGCTLPVPFSTMVTNCRPLPICAM